MLCATHAVRLFNDVIKPYFVARAKDEGRVEVEVHVEDEVAEEANKPEHAAKMEAIKQEIMKQKKDEIDQATKVRPLAWSVHFFGKCANTCVHGVCALSMQMVICAHVCKWAMFACMLCFNILLGYEFVPSPTLLTLHEVGGRSSWLANNWEAFCIPCYNWKN